MSATRFTHLDTVRGVAVLGILVMNGVSFGIGMHAYYNISAGGVATPLDWGLAAASEVFADQKFMGLFSLLFGASFMLFLERAEAKGDRPARRALWRNALLLVLGIAHSLIWSGDVLALYAFCAPVLLAVRRLPPPLLIVAGCGLFLVSSLLAAVAQGMIPDAAWVGFWFPSPKAIGAGAVEISNEAGLFLILDAVCRALGMMWLGMGLYASGALTEPWDTPTRVRWGVVGVVAGALVSSAGVAWLVARDFTVDLALLAYIPNSLATVPVVLGYFALISAWDARAGDGWWVTRFRAVGRMALTNYIGQTLLGLACFTALGTEGVTRTMLWGFILAVWAFQLWASERWLRSFRFGPLEWLWRCATYARWEPMRRTD